VTNAELIRIVGPALWGTRWHTDMAQTLGVSDRTVRRWVSGRDAPRPGIWTELVAIIRERCIALGELLAVVEQHAGERSVGQPRSRS
jgi:hypothetical protein